MTQETALFEKLGTALWADLGRTAPLRMNGEALVRCIGVLFTGVLLSDLRWLGLPQPCTTHKLVSKHFPFSIRHELDDERQRPRERGRFQRQRSHEPSRRPATTA